MKNFFEYLQENNSEKRKRLLNFSEYIAKDGRFNIHRQLDEKEPYLYLEPAQENKLIDIDVGIKIYIPGNNFAFRLIGRKDNTIIGPPHQLESDKEIEKMMSGGLSEKEINQKLFPKYTNKIFEFIKKINEKIKTKIDIEHHPIDTEKARKILNNIVANIFG